MGRIMRLELTTSGTTNQRSNPAEEPLLNKFFSRIIIWRTLTIYFLFVIKLKEMDLNN